ncbi:hypothetical protein PG984_008012 [Apiospora sp. TS-2023a]
MSEAAKIQDSQFDLISIPHWSRGRAPAPQTQGHASRLDGGPPVMDATITHLLTWLNPEATGHMSLDPVSLTKVPLSKNEERMAQGGAASSRDRTC